MATNAQILKRLAAIDAASATVDRERAEQAAAAHFEQLGLPVPPFRWAADGPTGLYEILSEGWARHLRSTEEDGSTLMHRLMKRVNETRDPAYVEKLSGLFPNPNAHEELPDFDNTPVVAHRSVPWMAAWAAAVRILREAGAVEGSAPFIHAAWALTPVGSTLSPSPAQLARGYLVDRRRRKAAAPMVEALEAGLWQFWPRPGETLLIARPAMKFVGVDLHDERGPAMGWPGGATFWALRDFAVAREVVESPSTIDPALLERESHPYVRGIIMERYRRDRYVSDLQGAIVATTPAGTLIRLRPAGREPFAFVEIRRGPPNFPAEYIRVPESVTTPEEGLAWTLGLTAAEYAPEDSRDAYAREEIGPVAREIIDRLRRVDRARPALDRARAKAALARRFPSSAGPGVRTGWLAGNQLRGVRDMRRCGRRGHLEDDREFLEPFRLSDAFDSAAAVCRMLEERNAVSALGGHPDHEVAFRSCQAAEVAALMHQGDISLDGARFESQWMSWVDLYEAGVGGLWTSEGQIVALPRPAMRFRNGRLHDEGGPAVSWPGGPEFRYLDGERVGDEEE